MKRKDLTGKKRYFIGRLKEAKNLPSGCESALVGSVCGHFHKTEDAARNCKTWTGPGTVYMLM